MQNINHEEDIRLWKGNGEVYQLKQWYGVVWFPLATPKYSIHTWLAVSVWRERDGRKHGDHHQPASRLQHMNDKIISNRISTIQHTRRKGYEGAMSVWFAYHTN
ncbi:hypothetical protein Bca52824_068645 [Brassica carinata]|uniref:Uncharacterized protein n=1 Tax=Brassica carinata TaxID=52824 RepID=A0A8X7Q0Q6_BRACI|nr:hypothetical protein Bca52824_068645 [Brassica carinata]